MMILQGDHQLAPYNIHFGILEQNKFHKFQSSKFINRQQYAQARVSPSPGGAIDPNT